MVWLTILAQTQSGGPLFDFCGRPFGTSFRTIVYNPWDSIVCFMLTMWKAQKGTINTTAKKAEGSGVFNTVVPMVD